MLMDWRSDTKADFCEGRRGWGRVRLILEQPEKDPHLSRWLHIFGTGKEGLEQKERGSVEKKRRQSRQGAVGQDPNVLPFFPLIFLHPPAASPEGYRLTYFSPCCLPAEMWVQLKIKRASTSVLPKHQLINSTLRNKIFCLMQSDKILKCQQDKNKINNSNKSRDEP